MKTVIVHGQSHKGSTYHIARIPDESDYLSNESRRTLQFKN